MAWSMLSSDAANLTALSRNLKALREGRRETLRDVAGNTGLSAGYLSALENGAGCNPGAKLLVKLADYFQCSVDFLLGRPVKRDQCGPLFTVIDSSRLTTTQRDLLDQLMTHRPSGEVRKAQKFRT